MTMTATTAHSGTHRDTPSHWLKGYYFARFAFSAIWVLAAVAVAKNVPVLAAAMLVGYPAWDAIANLVDVQRSGASGRTGLNC